MVNARADFCAPGIMLTVKPGRRIDFGGAGMDLRVGLGALRMIQLPAEAQAVNSGLVLKEAFVE